MGWRSFRGGRSVAIPVWTRWISTPCWPAAPSSCSSTSSPTPMRPGSRHAKRWQDVEELLEHGIDVLTTVNVQHLESLNDVVERITGVRQQETVPDDVVRRAEQLELVDITLVGTAPTPRARQRLHGREGSTPRWPTTSSPSNLTALRELALLWVADEVDVALQRYRHDKQITEVWETRERVVVGLTGGKESETAPRRAARIAKRSGAADLLAVHILRGDGLAGSPVGAVARLRRLAADVGAKLHTVVGGEDVWAALLDFARWPRRACPWPCPWAIVWWPFTCSWGRRPRIGPRSPNCSVGGMKWRPDVALVLLLGVDEGGRPSRVLGPAIAQYLRDLAAPGTERVLLLIGEVAPNHWWEQVLFNRRGAVVARYAGRHTTAVVCRLRFRLLPRTSNITPGHARRPRGLVLVGERTQAQTSGLYSGRVRSGRARGCLATFNCEEHAMDIRPFVIGVPEEQLVDLRRRITATNWPDREADPAQGVQLHVIQALARYWADDYDWRTCERPPPHFRSSSPRSTGSISTSSCEVEARERAAHHHHPWLARLLHRTDENHRAAHRSDGAWRHGQRRVPRRHSLASRLRFFRQADGAGWNPPRIARAWAALMQRLGYTRYVAQGGDWGNAVSENMALQQPPGLLGIHTNMPAAVPLRISRNRCPQRSRRLVSAPRSAPHGINSAISTPRVLATRSR